MRIIVEIDGWFKEEEISYIDYYRGWVKIEIKPPPLRDAFNPVYSKPSNRPIPSIIFTATGTTRYGLPLFTNR